MDARQRIFNIPFVVLALAAFIGLVHAVIVLFLTSEQTGQVLILFSFIPARYAEEWLSTADWIVGWGPAIWTFVTYAFIHSNLNHLFFNEVWLLAFGTPLARRFGVLRFLIFFALTAAAGAAAHLATHVGELNPTVGASAAVSGAMAAALRFVFQRGGPLSELAAGDHAYRRPAVSLSAMLRDPRALAFIAIWFALNLVFGFGTFAMPGMEDQAVAWEAHIGGFVAGLLAFSLLDPVGNEPPAGVTPPTAPTDM